MNLAFLFLKKHFLPISLKAITGTTEANAKVTVTIGKKTYSGTANSKGAYSIKIPQQKIGTSYKVKSISKTTNFYNTVTGKVTKGKTSFSLPYYLTRNSTSITGKVSNISSGDYIVAKIGNKTYKGTINTAKKTFTIKVPKQKTGTKVTVKILFYRGASIYALF